jgi:hypothetical protein
MSLQAVCKSAAAVAAMSAVLLTAATPAAAEQARVKLGTLICRVGPGIGALIASRRRMACRFEAGDGRVERYSGTITRFGLDVGVTAGGVMTWLVVARTRHRNAGALAGHYVGVSAEASLGLGAGAKVLVGGSRRSTVLQPLSALGKAGVNLAVGVAGLTLRYQGHAESTGSNSETAMRVSGGTIRPQRPVM